MLAHTKKHHTERPLEVRFIGSREKIGILVEYARKLGVYDATDTVSIEEAFPGYSSNPLGLALRGARNREGLTQRKLAEATGIPQRHISEMESGKRQIGRERAKKLADVLHVSDYRVFM
jgi:DNA-binding XRE family transcriptional regulator